MNDYTIVRVGNDYVVKAAAQGILKTASRRMALRIIAEASHLLDVSCLPEVSPQPGQKPSNADHRAEAS
jgi:hypothetical protein